MAENTHVCPKCGKNVDLSFTRTGMEIGSLHVNMKCEGCGKDINLYMDFVDEYSMGEFERRGRNGLFRYWDSCVSGVGEVNGSTI